MLNKFRVLQENESKLLVTSNALVYCLLLQIIMGYLFFSVEYPTDAIRASYLESISPNFRSVTFPLYQPLPASATIDEWKGMLTILQEYCPASVWMDEHNSHSLYRPLKPNDDNYEAFKGLQWNTRPTTQEEKHLEMSPPAIAAFLGKTGGNDNLVGESTNSTPHYDHCANCTHKAIHSTMKRCSRCKMVQYCSRNCQAQHWKACHKQSCVSAQTHRTLREALQTNDGFLVTSDECQVLSTALYASLKEKQDETFYETNKKYMVEGFANYFGYVSNLGGCFVL